LPAVSRVSERPATIFSSVGGRPERLNGDPPGPAGTVRPPRFAVADAGILAGVVLLGVVLPVALALWAHAFAIPRYDDWAYRRVLMDFVHSGHLSLVGWGAMTLVGQIFWAAPFVDVLGAHPWVPDLTVAVASTIGLGSGYWLARSVLGRARGAACTLALLVLPGVLVQTSTFMTDLPALSAELACLALGAAALRRTGASRWGLLIAAVVVGCLGFSVREFDLAAPAAVLIALGAQDRRHRFAYVVAGALTLAVCGAVFVWATHLPHAQQEALGLPTASTVRALAAAFFTLALFVSPFLPAAARTAWRSSFRAELVAASVVLAIGVLLIATNKAVFTGNYLAQQGMSTNASLPGGRPSLFPAPIWALLRVVAVAAGAALAFVVTNATRSALRSRLPAPSAHTSAPEVSEKSLVSLFTCLTAAGLAGYGLLVQAAIFDRYLWALAFGSAVLLASFGARTAALARRPVTRHWRVDWSAHAAPAALATILTVLAGAIVLNADAYDGARWLAGQEATKVGVAAATIDAGFDWVGSHTAETAVRRRPGVGALPYEMWYDEMFPRFKECAFVSGSPVAHAHLARIGTERYNELLFALTERLYIYAVRTPACDGRL
jgi:Dolichyl-phosphate-mannose-protein mannosyltransferase